MGLAQKARMEALSLRELRDAAWLQSAIVTEQVVDLLDPVQFPELAAARAHLASLSPERRAELDREWK